MKKADVVAALLGEQLRRKQLLEQLRTLIPEDLAARCCQVSVEGANLNVLVSTPAWADRLRRLGPRLIYAANAIGAQVTSCRIRSLPIQDQPAAGTRQTGPGLEEDDTYSYGESIVACVHQAAKELDHLEVGRSLSRLHRTLTSRSHQSSSHDTHLEARDADLGSPSHR